jgi:hypothetical protein
MITLPIQLEQQINHIAAIEHTPANSLVVETLAEFVEDYHDAKTLESAWREFEASGMQALSLDELNHEMDS